MGPQVRQMLQTPMFREMLTNPQTLQMAMQQSQQFRNPNASRNVSPGLFGLAQQQAQSETSTSSNSVGIPPNLTSLFGPGSPFGQLGNGGPTTSGGQQDSAGQMQQLQQLLGLSGMNGSTPMMPPIASDTRPPEERFQVGRSRSPS